MPASFAPCKSVAKWLLRTLQFFCFSPWHFLLAFRFHRISFSYIRFIRFYLLCLCILFFVCVPFHSLALTLPINIECNVYIGFCLLCSSFIDWIGARYARCKHILHKSRIIHDSCIYKEFPAGETSFVGGRIFLGFFPSSSTSIAIRSLQCKIDATTTTKKSQ